MPASRDYRALSQDEIETMRANGCFAEDWSRVQVAEGFAADRVRAVAFCGDVRLGRLAGRISLPGSIDAPCMIAHAALHNCTVGDDCLIRNVRRAVANYDIGDGVVIEDVSSLVMAGESAFGNGVMVEALNEGGGREVKIFDRLSSQIAYVLAVYRYRPEVVEKIEAMIDEYVAGVRSARGTIGDGAQITSCGTIEAVRIGPAARVRGAVRLVNGSVNSTAGDPATVGDGVIAENFIFSSGTRVDGGAMVTSSFVGQGTRIGRQFSAENSLFFANCEGFHGEACSLFAGPYTVTHHKSSLLIAGLFSFYNAGSGTNQSNHMYKLGPVHQGVLERGSKTGSFAYLLWSAHAAPFTAIIGKHTSKFDASEFPFSYIMESEGKSLLIPGFNFATVGTRRDSAKWPARDRRRDLDRLDCLTFDVLSPYTVGRMIQGRRVLQDLQARTPADRTSVNYRGAQIPRLRFAKGIEVYNLAIGLYLNGKIATYAEELLDEGAGADLLTTLLKSAGETGLGEWVDVCGLMTPAARIHGLLDEVAAGKMKDTAALESAIRRLHAAYGDLEWDWVVANWLAEIGKERAEVTLADVAKAVGDWKDAVARANNATLADAKKEFGTDVRIGFGLDGGPEAEAADFEAVRGTFDGNKFVREIGQHSAEVTERAEKLLAALGQLGK